VDKMVMEMSRWSMIRIMTDIIALTTGLLLLDLFLLDIRFTGSVVFIWILLVVSVSDIIYLSYRDKGSTMI
jgi:hypothetical protein